MSSFDLYIWTPVAFILIFSLFMCYFRTSYYENSKIQVLFCVVFSAFIGAGAVMLVLGVLDFLRGTFYKAEPQLDAVICGAIGGAASRLLNILIRRFNGLTLINLKDIAEMREQMTATERMIHAVECPFHKEHARLHARSHPNGMTAEVGRLLDKRGRCHETSGELSVGCFNHGAMVGSFSDRIASERESAVDNGTENGQ